MNSSFHVNGVPVSIRLFGDGYVVTVGGRMRVGQGGAQAAMARVVDLLTRRLRAA